MISIDNVMPVPCVLDQNKLSFQSYKLVIPPDPFHLSVSQWLSLSQNCISGTLESSPPLPPVTSTAPPARTTGPRSTWPGPARPSISSTALSSTDSATSVWTPAPVTRPSSQTFTKVSLELYPEKRERRKRNNNQPYSIPRLHTGHWQTREQQQDAACQLRGLLRHQSSLQPADRGGRESGSPQHQHQHFSTSQLCHHSVSGTGRPTSWLRSSQN